MKNLKISTELASAVLGKEVTKCSLINKERNSINITYFEDKEDFNTICRGWNIYEFAFKCKEWAYKNEYDIWSITWGAVEFQNNKKYNGTERITEDTEIEAIIKACEWILEKETQEEDY